MPNHVRVLGVAMLLLLLASPSVWAADCERCGKTLKWGFGTCAECKAKAARELVQEINEDQQIEQKVQEVADTVKERVEKNAESQAKSGTVHRFEPKGSYKYIGDPNRSVVFVNGMRTDFDEFLKQVQALSDVLGRPVTAVYAGGATRGLATSIALQIQNWSQEGPARQLPEGQALMSVLRAAETEKKRVDLVCHSRGTMLSEAILHDWPWAAENVTVYAFGCAVSGSFPVREYYKIVNRDDDVMKDRMVDKRNLVWGHSGGHGIEDYIENLRTGNYDADLPLTK